MLDNKPPSVFDDLSAALGASNPAIGQAVVLDYDSGYQLIAYYTGFAEGMGHYYTSAGFAKNIWLNIPGAPRVALDTEFNTASEVLVLNSNESINNTTNGSLDEKLKKLKINTPVELVFWPNYGFIGYWNGVDKDGVISLNTMFNKLTGEYSDIAHIDDSLVWSGNRHPIDKYNLPYEIPNAKQLATVYILNIQQNNTESSD